MGKVKGYFVAAVIMALLAVVVYCLWSYSIRTYWIVTQILALYGFIVGGVNLAKWLTKAETETRSNKRFKDPWMDGMEEEN